MGGSEVGGNEEKDVSSNQYWRRNYSRTVLLRPGTEMDLQCNRYDDTARRCAELRDFLIEPVSLRFCKPQLNLDSTSNLRRLPSLGQRTECTSLLALRRPLPQDLPYFADLFVQSDFGDLGVRPPPIRPFSALSAVRVALSM